MVSKEKFCFLDVFVLAMFGFLYLPYSAIYGTTIQAIKYVFDSLHHARSVDLCGTGRMITLVIDAYVRIFTWANVLLLLIIVSHSHDLLLSFLFRSAPPNTFHLFKITAFIFCEERIAQIKKYTSQTGDEYIRGLKSSLEVLAASQKHFLLEKQYAARKLEYQQTKNKVLALLGL